jgi:hypothetical protein
VAISSASGLTNRASAAGAGLAGAPCARSFYATGQADKRNSSLLGRARQLQALVRRRPHRDAACHASTSCDIEYSGAEILSARR